MLNAFRRVLCFRSSILGAVRFSSASNVTHEVSVRQALDGCRIGQKLKINAWIKSVRSQKKNTFLDLSDGMTCSKLQVVVESSSVNGKNLKMHEAVSVTGILKHSQHPQQVLELEAESVSLVNDVSLPAVPANKSVASEDDCNDWYPFCPRKFYPDDFTRRYPMFRAKLNDFACLLRLRSSLSFAVHSFFQTNDFVQVHTPVITSNDCEGSGEVFTVKPASRQVIQAMKKSTLDQGAEAEDHVVYFGRDVYLTVSGQLHLEAVCNGLKRVYAFSPTFRAEMGRSKRHLSEFLMVEAEIAFVDEIQSVSDLIERLVKSSLASVMSTNFDDFKTYEEISKINKDSKQTTDFQLLQRVVDVPFVTMAYSEVMDVLEKNSSRFKSKPKRGSSLGKEHELFVAEKYCNNVPVFVINWPNETKPFYVRLSEDGEAMAVDLLFPKVGELCGGSLREHDANALSQRIVDSGLSAEPFDWYLKMRKAGAAPTGGFGMGFERLVQFALGVNNIKDALPFPRSPHSCPL